jgi:hypothetical protein
MAKSSALNRERDVHERDGGGYTFRLIPSYDMILNNRRREPSPKSLRSLLRNIDGPPHPASDIRCADLAPIPSLCTQPFCVP